MQVNLLAVHANSDFINEPRFVESYMDGLSTLAALGEHGNAFVYDAWRVRIALWAAEHASRLRGDFVECGVNTGFLSKAIVRYLSFGNIEDKRFYLVDTFEGVPEDQFSEEERSIGLEEIARGHYNRDVFEICRKNFALYPNVLPVRGRVPEILSTLPAERVCYLSIDMNCAEPEIAAVRFFWPRLVPGAVILFDDYGFSTHINQKLAVDRLAGELGMPVLALPSGQAIVLKSGG